MTKRYTRSNTTTAELVADYLDQRDEEVMQALVTAGAFVAFADGRVEAIERDELVNYIHRQRLVPTISQRDIAEAFDNRVRQLEDRDSASVIVETFRPLAGLSLSSVVVSTAERVAAADRHISQRIAGHQADMPDHDELADQEAARVKRFMIIGSRGSLDDVDPLGPERFAVHAVNLAQGPSRVQKARYMTTLMRPDAARRHGAQVQPYLTACMLPDYRGAIGSLRGASVAFAAREKGEGTG